MMFLTWRLLGWYVSVREVLSSVLGSVGLRAVSLSILRTRSTVLVTIELGLLHKRRFAQLPMNMNLSG